MSLRMEVGLSPGHFVLDEEPVRPGTVTMESNSLISFHVYFKSNQNSRSLSDRRPPDSSRALSDTDATPCARPISAQLLLQLVLGHRFECSTLPPLQTASGNTAVFTNMKRFLKTPL